MTSRSSENTCELGFRFLVNLHSFELRPAFASESLFPDFCRKFTMFFLFISFYNLLSVVICQLSEEAKFIFMKGCRHEGKQKKKKDRMLLLQKYSPPNTFSNMSFKKMYCKQNSSHTIHVTHSIGKRGVSRRASRICCCCCFCCCCC